MQSHAPQSRRLPTKPALSSRMKRWLYLLHRWAGIVLCAFFAMWFISGVVMMYVGYPKLTPAEYRQHLAPLHAEAISISPDQARRAATGLNTVSEIRLAATRAGLPVYLLAGTPSSARAVVDASTGALLGTADAATALATGQAYFNGQFNASYAGEILEDMYTHSRALDSHRPLHVIDMDDPAHTRLYVSSATAAVVLDATRTERLWNIVGAWIHWLYPFRGNFFNQYWHDIVVYLSVAGVLLTITGTIVGLLRWRFSRPYASGSRSPYREKVMRWHHVSGLIFAVITFTWILSGLLSMNPWKVFSSDAKPLAVLAYKNGLLEPTDAFAHPTALLDALPGAPRELVWVRNAGRDLVLAYGATGLQAVLQAHDAQAARIDPDALRSAAALLIPDASVTEVEVLNAYDAYYYSRDEHAMLGHVERPLPVWRVVFDNPQASWVYLDPRTGQILSRQDRSNRVSRWLFAFLHSWDWPGLLARRPLWDALMILLSLGGVALSITGVVIGWRRLGRKLGS